MLQIDLVNVQAIGEAHILIEDNSICEFTGDNSNGKSVVSKVIEKLVSGDLREPSVRNALIKDGTDQGVVIFTANNRQLGIMMKRETRDCFLMYIPNMDEKDKQYVRAFSDTNGYNAIVRQFGFRAYAQGDICLQLSPTFGAIPFITTNGNVNAEIEKDITVDKVADEFLKAFKTITFPIFRETIKQKKQQRDNIQVLKDNLESYDWRAYESFIEDMSRRYQAIRTYKYATIKPIEVPCLELIRVPNVTVEPIPFFEFTPILPTVELIGESLTNYISVLNGVCPTCGRPFVEHGNGE